MLALAAIVLLVAMTPNDEDSPLKWPDDVKLDEARVDWVHQQAGDGMAHCVKTRREHCRRLDAVGARLSCSYEEAAPEGKWKRKTTVIGLNDDDEWVWVGGDTPRCSIVVFTEP